MELRCLLYIMLMWVIPMSYCYYDSGSLTLMKRMEALERRDEEKSIMIGRLASQLGSQETKIQAMESTIDRLQRDSTMYYHEITKNGAALAKTYAHVEVGRHGQGSVTVITQLIVGDEVWVKHTYPTDGQLWGERFTSFTGVWLSEM